MAPLQQVYCDLVRDNLVLVNAEEAGETPPGELRLPPVLHPHREALSAALQLDWGNSAV